MNRASDQVADTPALPQLEQLLVRAARRHAVPKLTRRRWTLAVALASLTLAGGAAAAGGVLHIADGTTSEGSYSVEGGPSSTAAREELPGSICLQLRYNDRGPAYGCGDRPSAREPFGLVVADPLGESPERVIYGLVANEIATVAVLHPDGGRTTAQTEAKPPLPGRFFSVAVQKDRQIDLIGYDFAGKRVAEIGSLAPPTEPPLSRRQAIEQGDPAGFAPGVAAPGSVNYQGHDIAPSEVVKLHLSCIESREVTRCYGSPAEIPANEGVQPRRETRSVG